MPIHKIIRKSGWSADRYLCNQATGTTKQKSSYRWDKVTCKNCLKQQPTQNKTKVNKEHGNQ